ncbi:amino acid adenylation domain-containing protein, partial [Massilia sp. BJB1822]|uniref:amino acid adenylation domain-containing protein n=1 Tax=Massilia sp. BJB1822 TaxID=2744470 RepID=UPI0015930DF2
RLALRQPQRRALVSGEREFTYGELAGHAAAISAALRQAGCAPGQLVAVWMDKGWEQVAAVLGVLHADAAWLPIDTNQPPARRAQLLADAGVQLVLTQSWLAESAAPDAGQRLIAVDALTALAALAEAPPCRAKAGDLAYVIYTSGSSGKPKGVMVSHAAALNTIVDINQRFAVTADERVFGLANLGFDLSVYDVLGPLSLGACLVLPDAARRADPSHWAELIARHRLTLWNSVPAQLQMLEHCLAAMPQLDLASLRLAMLSGDWIPLGLPEQMRRRLPQLEVVSLGGATEAAIWSIYHRIGAPQPGLSSIPYGKPLANQQFHVLAEGWRDCPELVAGELYIGGDGLALGYLGDPVQTAQRFVIHPRSAARLYRTGDLGRYLRDGSIEFLGREDAQVKIRGNRVELAEVEAALAAHPAVREVAVIVDGDARLNRRLVAFAVPRAGLDGAAPDAAALSAHAAQLLPPYMVPGRIEILSALPLSENGKVDRRALRNLAADLPSQEADAGEGPRNALEERLERIWAEVLELPKVGREQDFFRLGGDSLRAARLVGRVRESVPEAAGMFFDSLVRQLLPSPTIAALAAYLAGQRAARPAVAAVAPASSPLLRLDGAGTASAAGTGPARVLVHDGAGRLGAFRTPLAAMAEQGQGGGPLFGLCVNEAASYLHPGPAALLERRAISYARLLQAHGQRSVQLAGCGFGALLALELARQLSENGVDVLSLVLLAPRALARPVDAAELAALFAQETDAAPAWPDIDRIDDPAQLQAIFGDSVRAGASYAASPYLGDATLLQCGATPAGGVDWDRLIVGELRRIELGGDASPGALAASLFPAALMAGAGA